MSRRVLVAQIMHETNTFSVIPTDIDAYRRRYLLFGDEIPKHFRGTRSELGGAVDAAAELGWSIVTPVAANATPSGKVTAECWQMLKGAVLDGVAGHGPFDGIYLALHGAMVSEAADDAEGALLAELREAIGPQVPVAVTLDLHANATEAMAANADIVVAYRTYPHIDQYERAQQACRLLNRAMAGEVRPKAVLARGPMLIGVDSGRTQGNGPMARLLRKAEALEQDPDVLAVSIQAGFAPADIAEAGPSVVVTGNGDSPRYAEIAKALFDEVWETRHERLILPASVPDAIARVTATGPDRRPFVLSDGSDNPGSGAYGDHPTLLRAMIAAGLQNAAFATITDPEAVDAAYAAGAGAEVTIPLGGKVDPKLGEPIALPGRVLRLWDGAFTCDGPMWRGMTLQSGRSFVYRIGGVDVVVTSNRLQVTDLQQFLAAGINPSEKAVVGVKSVHHFRAAFEPIAREVISVDAGGLVSPDLSRRTYRKLRRPIFPLDLD